MNPLTADLTVDQQNNLKIPKTANNSHTKLSLQVILLRLVSFPTEMSF